VAATLVRLARSYGGIADMLLEEVRIVSIVIDIFCVQCIDHSKTFSFVYYINKRRFEDLLHLQEDKITT
jgi:hypothetical protein